jgi:hypothetical protein
VEYALSYPRKTRKSKQGNITHGDMNIHEARGAERRGEQVSWGLLIVVLQSISGADYKVESEGLGG